MPVIFTRVLQNIRLLIQKQAICALRPWLMGVALHFARRRLLNLAAQTLELGNSNSPTLRFFHLNRIA